MKYKAIIFDFDGVVAKTMEDNYRAWWKAFDNLDIVLGKEEYFLLEGLNAKSTAETILKKHSMNNLLAKTVATQKEQYYLQDHTFEFYPGVLNLIEILGDRFLLGLVSGAGHSRLQHSVGIDFLGKFDIVINGDTVQNPKPHSEPYLLALDKLPVVSPQCIAVENAPLGIESAKAAQMDCVGICSTLERRHLTKADFILNHIGLLNEFLNNLEK